MTHNPAPILSANSTRRLEKPHSLSYQLSTRTSAPSITAVWVAYGALFFWLIGGIAGVPVLSILPIAAAAGAVLLLRWDRNNLGYTRNNFRRGRALPYTIGLMAILVGLCFVARHVRDGGYPMIAGIGVGLAAFAVATIASVLISRTYLRELTGGEG